jgi:hypothetical protein
MNIDFVKAIYLLFPNNEMMTKNMEVFWLCLMCLYGLRMSSRATQNWILDSPYLSSFYGLPL